MIFEWDENKNRANKTKHRISFDTAKMVFFDPCCLIRFDRVADDEERWHAIGRVKGGLFFFCRPYYTLCRPDRNNKDYLCAATRQARKETI